MKHTCKLKQQDRKPPLPYMPFLCDNSTEQLPDKNNHWSNQIQMNFYPLIYYGHQLMDVHHVLQLD